MKMFLSFVVACAWSIGAFGQSRTDATLKITVVDESGGVIVGARVDVKPLAGGGAVTVDTGGRGDAIFAALVPGRYAIHVEARSSLDKNDKKKSIARDIPFSVR